MTKEERQHTKLDNGYYEDDFTYKYVDSRGTYTLDKPKEGVNPFIAVHSNTIPKAWELAMLACWDYGTRVGTHYDPTEDTPKSKEGTITIKVSNPFNEPRIHKNFPGGPEELESYRQEVVNGIHNHWIDFKNPTKWKYTYHERLTDYRFSINLKAENGGYLFSKGINQIEDVLEELVRDITSKAAQATTWIPGADIKMPGDRTCLQRLWFRPLLIDKKDESKGYLLNLNTHWRSRDLAKAWFMNVYAITDWQREIANMLEKKIKKPVKVGSYLDISDSLHIYGAYFNETKAEFEKMREPNMEKRVWNSDHPAFKMMTEEAKANLAKDPDFYAKGDEGKK